MPTTILCLSSYFKGGAFLEECKRQGCHTILITSQDLEHEPWPREAIDEFYVMPFNNLFKQPDITHSVAFLARTRKIDRIVPLDDFDVETVADLREHFRMPGMGGSTARYFRDKLAMRVQARDEGIPVPDFVHVLNHDDVRAYMSRCLARGCSSPAPRPARWASARSTAPTSCGRMLEELGDRQSFYVLERFVPGDVFHVDSIIWNKRVLFTVATQYGSPPMTVYQGGGVFATSVLPYHSPEEQALQALNREVIAAMGMVRGVTHAEFIRGSADGEFYFLEIAARVGGANIDKMLEYATNINLWVEWARLELAHLRGEELPAAAGETRLCRPDRLPGSPAVARHRRLYRPGDGLAAAQGAPCGLHRRRAGPRPHPGAAGHYVDRIAADFTAVAPPKAGERPAS